MVRFRSSKMAIFVVLATKVGSLVRDSRQLCLGGCLDETRVVIISRFLFIEVAIIWVTLVAFTISQRHSQTESRERGTDVG